MSNKKTIYISEWSKIKAEHLNRKYGLDRLKDKDYDIVNSLEEQGKIKIRQLSNGIEIETNSYVGIISLSEFQIFITPKIPHIQLARLIAFSFGIDNIDFLEKETAITAETGLISEIMALLYHKEVENIMLKSLSKKYKEKEEEISSCRGSIAFSKLARNASLGLTLPCRYQELTVDIAENQLILATLKELLKWVNTISLKRRINLLIENLTLEVSHYPLTHNLVKRVKQESNRLTSHYSLLIELSEMLLNAADFTQAVGKNSFTSFLLDMNLLFERFLYQYFLETSEFDITIKYQSSLRNRYVSKKGQDHKLMPDYMFYRGKDLIAIADAKYKDYDNKSISSSDLYQLTVYGIANQQGVNTIYLFYPSVSDFTEREYLLKSNFNGGSIRIVVKGVSLKEMLSGISEISFNEVIKCT